MSLGRPALRVSLCLSIVFVGLLGMASHALAHAAYESSDPEPGARLDEAPVDIIVSYAEPPTQQSSFRVLDGCQRDVADFEVLNNTIEATVEDAQPGRWRVEWGVVSAVDGHLTRDNFSFTVAGEPDCSQIAAPDDPDDSSGPGSGALIPVVIATVVILAIAIVVRRSAAR